VPPFRVRSLMSERQLRESELIAQIVRAPHPYTESDSLAAGELWEMHKGRVFGFIKARTRNVDAAEDLLQETAIKVWEHLPRFDPGRGCFEAFARFWAGIVLMQYYHKLREWNRLFILFSDLAARFPSLPEEPEAEEVIAGLSRISPPDTPEESGIRAEIREWMLGEVFNGDTPPHQVIAWGFVKLLGWEAEQIVGAFSPRLLRDLGWELEEDCIQVDQLPAARVRACFHKFRQNLERKLNEVLKEGRTRNTWRHLLSRIAGETLLREYYTDSDDPAQNIRQWYSSVWRSVVKEYARTMTHAT
jgi:RNA polymerase sigma factor (sigma-70 family)